MRIPDGLAARLEGLVIVPWVVAVVAVVATWVRVIRKPGDFEDHWLIGQRFLERAFIYEGGFHGVYPPFWAMVHAPLALLPVRVASGLVYPAGLAMVVLLYVALNRLCARALPLDKAGRFWLVTLVVLLASRFVLGDLTASSYNTIMISLAWLGVLAWTRRREVLGGTLLGTAIALKCTMGVFLPYFLWKRQWKMAAMTAAATAVLFLAPALWLGPTGHQRTLAAWTDLVLGGVAAGDAGQGVLGDESLQNNSLKAGLVRFLVHLPEGHAGRIDGPLHVDVLDLSPAAAARTIGVIFAGLVLGVAWAFRAPVRERDDPVILVECACVTLLAPLLSPVTWTGHCVAVIPALYLVGRTALHDGWIDRWMLALVAVYFVLVDVLNRGLLGKAATEVLDSYHVQTWGMVLLLAATLGLHRRLIAARAGP
ncbi:MAG: glycosyltransferase family 87 protein [Planctomycetota bacterium]